MMARFGTAVVGIPVILYAVCAGNIWPLRVLLAVVGVISCIEFLRTEGVAKPPFWMTLLLAGFLTALTLWTPPHAAYVWFLAIYAMPTIEWFTRDSPRPLLAAGWILIPLLSAISLRSGSLPSPPHWAPSFEGNALLLLFLCLWAGDTMAYFVGRSYGKHKLAPAISPSKTWEGALANFAACVVIGWAFSTALTLPTEFGVVVGVVAGVLGQLGDLFQSAWKRRHSAKDSGSLLPGHGGALDRFDSLLFTLPAVNVLAFYWAV
ncbi:MAG: phosphatidate cytidylyltransferase [Armatimonadota bacterium]|nr:phosphatidate cytidylyltransferase [Armatimonadota bacterium]